MTTAMPLRLHGVTKAYRGRTVLGPIDLALEAGRGCGPRAARGCAALLARPLAGCAVLPTRPSLAERPLCRQCTGIPLPWRKPRAIGYQL